MSGLKLVDRIITVSQTPNVNKKIVKRIPLSNLRGSFNQETKKTVSVANIISERIIKDRFWFRISKSLIIITCLCSRDKSIIINMFKKS